MEAADPIDPVDPIETIRVIFLQHGAKIYGERVNQIQHALQCAMLAERAGASADLIAASLLHDIGHMLHRDAANALQQHTDDHHEHLGAKFLRRWFKPTVTEPVAMHVAAKRYLCTREPGYLASLSPVSLKTLAIQGGPMSARQAEDFETLPGCNDALALRRWDELSKDPALSTPSLDHFLKVAAGCLASRSEPAVDG